MIVNVDPRGRISLGKFGAKPGQMYRVTNHDERIYLEPVTAYTRSELEKTLGYAITDEQWEAMG